MKMKIRILALAILGLTLVVNSAFAKSVRITARNGVNVRNSAGKDIGGISRGEVVEVLRVEGSRTWIRYNGKEARIPTKFTEVVNGGGSDDGWTTGKVIGGSDSAPAPTPKPVVADDDDDNSGGSSFDSSIKYSCSNGAKDCTSSKSRRKFYNPAKADSGTCGDVTVDCGSHTIHFSGVRIPASEKAVNCGKKGKTKDGVGRIGGRHSGERVKNGIQIEGIPGMGASGGGRVFHLPWWNGNMKPTQLNSSNGCIHISPLVMALLKRCEGSKLTIKNSYGGRNNSTGKDTDEGSAQGYY